MIEHKAFDELKEIFASKDSGGSDIAAWIDRWFMVKEIYGEFEEVVLKNETELDE